MLCENCHNNEATVSYTEIVNGQHSEQNLCQECFTKAGMKTFVNQDLSLGSLLSSVLGFASNHSGAKAYTRNNVRCDGCGITFQEFSQKGRFGCSNCMNAFGSNIDDSLKRIHGSDRHVGKKPINYVKSSLDNEAGQSKGNQVNDLNQPFLNQVDRVETNDIDKLQEKLNQAVKKEEYEEAARLRDKIKELKKLKANKAEKPIDEVTKKGEKDN